MCNKRKNIGKYYAQNNLSDKEGYEFYCDVYSEERDNTGGFYAVLEDGREFKVNQDSDTTFSLYVNMDHQYTLISEDSVISES